MAGANDVHYITTRFELQSFRLPQFQFHGNRKTFERFVPFECDNKFSLCQCAMRFKKGKKTKTRQKLHIPNYYMLIITTAVALHVLIQPKPFNWKFSHTPFPNVVAN